MNSKIGKWEPTSPLYPLTLLQKNVLKKTLDSLEDHNLCFKDINSIFKKLETRITTKHDLFELIEKGGNAFFNHFVFCLMYMKEWCNEAGDVFHVHDVAMTLNSLLTKQMYRYVWFKVGWSSEKRLTQLNLVLRGRGWFMCPKEAKCDGMHNIRPGLMNWRGDEYLMMVESTCSCFLFLEDKNRFSSGIIKCQCVKYNLLLPTPTPGKMFHEKDSDEKSYDTVDNVLREKREESVEIDSDSDYISVGSETENTKEGGMDIGEEDGETEDEVEEEEGRKYPYEEEVRFIDGVRVSRYYGVDFKSSTPYSFKVGDNVFRTFTSDKQSIQEAYLEFLETE